jgi:hypothetical protein
MPRQPVICKCGSCDSVGYMVKISLNEATLKILQRAYKCQTVAFKLRPEEVSCVICWSPTYPKKKAFVIWAAVDDLLKKHNL